LIDSNVERTMQYVPPMNAAATSRHGTAFGHNNKTDFMLSCEVIRLHRASRQLEKDSAFLLLMYVYSYLVD